MQFKRLITGVMALMIISSVCAGQVSAVEKNSEKKEIDYSAYSAELDKTTYTGNDLGATYSKESTTFKVWSPKASSVKVNIFENGSDSEGNPGSILTEHLKLNKKTGVWSITIKENLAKKYYTYTVKTDNTEKETADVYAKACGVNGKRSMIIDLNTTNPDGWENDKHILVKNQTQASVWEVSVADFSSSESSGISPDNRGKYLAFTENDTTVKGIEGGSATCISYLKNLGVKYVQIMPFYDFGSVDESKPIKDQYNWGYDPVNYNCPEGSYSSNAYKGEVRIKECKQMIQALHNAGIGVIMDVVYNHTFSTDSVFQNTVPNYYYRMNKDGSFSNGSGCSNDTASEHKMFRKYMIDSVTYWASEYHIDGFRFDLMGLHDVTTMNNIRTALDNLYEDGSGKKILMYGEAWNMATNCDEGTFLANQDNMAKLDNRIGAFDDGIRDAIKGSTAGVDKGYVQSGKNRSSLKIGIAGQSDKMTGWANTTTQCVTYASCHDNLCLYDKLVDSVYGKDKDYRKRYEDLVAMNKLSGALVISSQGIPFMYSGEEFARSKDGDENSYASSREENCIDWTNIDEYSDIVEYYKGLYQIRNAFSAFSDCTPMSANGIKYISDVPSGVVAYTINNTESGKWNKMCLVFNGGEEEQTVKTDGDWIVVADEQTAGLRKIANVTGSTTVKAHSAVIMVDKKGYEKSNISSDEGAIVLNYYDDSNKELIKKQTVTGTVGSAYDVTNFAKSLNYDIKSVKGNKTGEFKDGVISVDLYVQKFDGKTSKVTFKFVDELNGADLTDSFVVTNRSGQQYFTPSIPTIKGYKLMLDKLPNNGAGKISDSDAVVTYHYTKLTENERKNDCVVNAIYMDDTGKIVETKTYKGVEGENYNIPTNEYENMSLISVPENSIGEYSKDEINVVLSYSSKPDPYKDMLIYVSIGLVVVALLCVGSAVYSSKKRKQRFSDNMDIE